jgi:hypothetical protein
MIILKVTCVSKYACIGIHMHKYIHTYIRMASIWRVFLNKAIYIYTKVHTCIHTYIHTILILSHMRDHAQDAHIHERIHTCIHTLTMPHKYRFKYTYTHTYESLPSIAYNTLPKV